MTDTHVVSALKGKRIQCASLIESLQGQIRQAVIDLDHVEAALRLFDPDVDLAALSPRKVAQVLADNHGDTGRVILETLRTSKRYRSSGDQTVRVEHVTVNEGGQAIVGNVSGMGRGGSGNSGSTP